MWRSPGKIVECSEWLVGGRVTVVMWQKICGSDVWKTIVRFVARVLEEGSDGNGRWTIMRKIMYRE